MLWVDRYRPKTLATLDYHEDLTARLQALVSQWVRKAGREREMKSHS